MDRLFLDGLDAERFEFLIEDLAQIHDHALMDLLPHVCTEDLDQRNLEGRNLAVHENTGQIQLDLEADVDIGAIDGWTPPQGETTIWDLIET